MSETPLVAKSSFNVIYTFTKPTVKQSFRNDLSQRRQLGLIHQYRADIRVKANWNDWLKTWTSKDCHRKMLLCLLGEAGQNRIAKSGKLAAWMAQRINDMMAESEEEDPYVQLLSEIASLRLFQNTSAVRPNQQQCPKQH